MELSGVTENQIKTGGVQDMKVDGEGSDAENDGSVERSPSPELGKEGDSTSQSFENSLNLCAHIRIMKHIWPYLKTKHMFIAFLSSCTPPHLV